MSPPFKTAISIHSINYSIFPSQRKKKKTKTINMCNKIFHQIFNKILEAYNYLGIYINTCVIKAI